MRSCLFFFLNIHFGCSIFEFSTILLPVSYGGELARSLQQILNMAEVHQLIRKAIRIHFCNDDEQESFCAARSWERSKYGLFSTVNTDGEEKATYSQRY